MISRQHDETCLVEIHNQTLTEFFASEYYHEDKKISDASLLFIRFKESGWHRFFLEVGVLFWDQVKYVDMEELYGIEGPAEFKLIDISARYNLKGLVLCSAEMCQTEHGGASAGCLTFQLERDVTVQLTHVYNDESVPEFSEYTILEVENA